MKKFLLLFVITVIAGDIAVAQTEGKISYTIEMSSDDPETAASIGMFGSSSMSIYFGNNIVRTELDYGSLIQMVTVINNKTNQVMVLMGGMMGSKGVLTNQTEMANGKEEESKSTVTLKKDKKTILGYKCKKAIITDKDGNTMEYWYTKKIPPVLQDKNSDLTKLPGMALEYTAKSNGITMTFKATEVETDLDANTITEKLSLLIPDGYEELSYEEFKALSGGL